MHGTPLEQRASDRRDPLGHVHALTDQPLVVGGEALEGHDPVDVPVSTRDVAVLGAAQLDGAVDDGLEHEVEVEPRLRNGLDDVVKSRFAVFGAA